MERKNRDNEVRHKQKKTRSRERDPTGYYTTDITGALVLEILLFNSIMLFYTGSIVVQIFILFYIG